MTFLFNRNNGFTLFELIFIIAIIAILFTIIWLSVSSYKDKAKNTRIFTALRRTKDFAEFIKNDTKSYEMLCNSPDINIDHPGYKNQLTEINNEIKNNGGEARCLSDENNYCVYSKINNLSTESDKYCCVDETGKFVTTDINPGTDECHSGGNFICP